MLFLKKPGCHLPKKAVIVVLHRKINLPQFFVEQIDPPSSVADAPASPQGEAFYVTSLVRRISTFFEAQRIRNPQSKIALSNRLPLGGKLARQRLMRGDKSPLSSFGISKTRRIQNPENKIALSNRLPLGKENINFFRSATDTESQKQNRTLKQASPRGEAGASATDEGG